MATPKLKQKTYETHPLILQRSDAIPTYERNNLVFNYDTSVSQIQYVTPGSTQREHIKLGITNYSSIEFNDREYTLKSISLYAPSIHKITAGLDSTSKPNSTVPAADLEVILQHTSPSLDGTTKKYDQLDISILCESGGNEFDKNSSFLNQIIPKINTPKTGQPIIISNGLNLYDVLPKNRSFFNYIRKDTDEINCIVFENIIKINSSELDIIRKKFKSYAPSRPAQRAKNQPVYYKPDRNVLLADIESEDTKYIKCSRKIVNEDPDVYSKYLYNRKKKDKKCDAVLNINKTLEQQFNNLNDPNANVGLSDVFTEMLGSEDNYKQVIVVPLFIIVFSLSLLGSYFIVRFIIEIIAKVRKRSGEGTTLQQYFMGKIDKQVLDDAAAATAAAATATAAE
jgi:carbonic anhydrase